MRKLASMVLAAAMSASLLAGCGSGAAETTATETSAETTAEAMETAESAAEETIAAESTDAEAESSDEAVIRVAGLKGPTTMGLVKLMDDSVNGVTNAAYEFTMASAADEITAMVAGGTVDIALLPANVASVLYNKTEGGVEVIDINTLGVLYLVSGETEIASIADLKGKTVYLTGKGATPEYALRYLLQANDLTDADVTLEFKSEASEVAAVLAEDPTAIGLLPQPFVTSAIAQNDKLSIKLNLTEEWDKVQEDGSGSRLVTGVTIVRTDFLAEHEDLVQSFLEEHAISTAYTEEDPEGAAQLIEAQGIVAKAAIAQKALPYCSITCITGEEMKEALSGYLTALYEQNPASVGGALPDDTFYYIP